MRLIDVCVHVCGQLGERERSLHAAKPVCVCVCAAENSQREREGVTFFPCCTALSFKSKFFLVFSLFSLLAQLLSSHTAKLLNFCSFWTSLTQILSWRCFLLSSAYASPILLPGFKVFIASRSSQQSPSSDTILLAMDFDRPLVLF